MNDPEILATLQRILKLQEEAHAIQKQAFELQQKWLSRAEQQQGAQAEAIETQKQSFQLQQLAVAHQAELGRAYRAFLIFIAIIIAIFAATGVYFILNRFAP